MRLKARLKNATWMLMFTLVHMYTDICADYVFIYIFCHSNDSTVLASFIIQFLLLKHSKLDMWLISSLYFPDIWAKIWI